jgi:transglutaminase-like putative cysteine protease
LYTIKARLCDARKDGEAGAGGITPGRPRFDAPEPSAPERFVLFATLMLLGMFGAVSSFYSVFRIDVDVGAMILFTACLAVGATALFLSKHRRVILFAVLGAVAAICLLFWERLRELVFRGAVHVVNTVIVTYGDRANIDFAPIPMDPAAEGDIHLSTMAFAMSLLLFVALLLGWLLIGRRSAFFAFLLTLPFPAVALAYTIVPDFAALMVIGLFWFFIFLCVAPLRRRDRFVERHPGRSRAGRTYLSGGRFTMRPAALALIPLIALCLFLTALIFPSDGYRRLPLTDDLRSGVVSGRIGLAMFRGGGIAGNTNRVNLGIAGNLRYRNETVIRVKSAKRTPDYLKGFVGSVYTGTGWEQLPDSYARELETITAETQSQNYPSTLYGLFDLGMEAWESRESGRSPSYRLTVENVKMNPRSVYSPYGLSSTPGALEEIEFASDGFLRSSNSLFGTGGYTLEAISLPPVSAYLGFPDFDELSRDFSEFLSPEQLSFFEEQSRYRAFADERYTALPDGVKAEMREYLLERGLDPAIPRGNTADFVLEVIRQVQSENAYTRSPGVTPEGRDFAAYFLKENHRGYCAHFATAVAVLLRSAGIPARYAEGFVVSPDDPVTEDGWVNIADSRAHAWAEVYIYGVGWLPVEATPSRQSGVTVPMQASAIGIPVAEAPTPEVADSTSAGAVSGAAVNTATGAAAGGGASGGGISGGAAGASGNHPAGGAAGGVGGVAAALLSIPVILCAVIVAALLLIFAARAFRRRRVLERERLFGGADRAKAALAVYAYVDRITRFMRGGRKMPDEPAPVLPQELMDIVMEARFSRREPPREALDRLTAYAEELSVRARKDAGPFRALLGKYVHGLF